MAPAMLLITRLLGQAPVIYAEIYQILTGLPASSAVHTTSIWFKAYAAGDVGKKITLGVNNGLVFYGVQVVTLTADWVRYTCTGALLRLA